MCLLSAARLKNKVHADVDLEAMGRDGAGDLTSSLPFIPITLVRLLSALCLLVATNHHMGLFLAVLLGEGVARTVTWGLLHVQQYRAKVKLP